MPMSEKVLEHLGEAEASLRAALAFAARTEKPIVTQVIAESISRIDTLIESHKILDKLESRNPGDKGIWGMFHE